MNSILHHGLVEYFSDPNNIIALCAILALILNVIMFREISKYNRKSLELTIDYNKKSLKPLVTHSYTISTNGSSSFELLVIENKGLGPVIINSVKLKFGGKTYSSSKEFYSNKNPEALRKLDELNSENPEIVNYALYPGEKVDYIRNTFKDRFNLKGENTLWSTVKLIVEFQNLFGEKDKYEVNI